MAQKIFIFCALFFSLSLSAETNVDKFLASAWRSKEVSLQDKNLKEFGDTSFSNPIEAVQLKISRQDDQDNIWKKWDKLETGIRFHPRGFNEYLQLRKLNAQSTRLVNLSYKAELSKALEERYLAIVEYANAIDRRKSLTELVSVARKELSMVRTAARASSLDAHILVKTSQDYDKCQKELFLVESEVKLALLKMKSLDPELKEERILARDLPSPEELSNNLNKLSMGKEDVRNFNAIQLATEKVQLVESSLAYDVAREGKLIDYFEMTVEERPGPTQRTYAFEMSFNIPGFSSGSPDAIRRTAELVKYKVDAEEAIRLQELTLASSRQSFQRAVEVHGLYMDSKDSLQEIKIKKLAQRQNPLLAVMMEKSAIERSLKAKEMAAEVYEAYISYLSSANILAENPKTNFLSKDLAKISL